MTRMASSSWRLMLACLLRHEIGHHRGDTADLLVGLDGLGDFHRHEIRATGERERSGRYSTAATPHLLSPSRRRRIPSLPSRLQPLMKSVEHRHIPLARFASPAHSSS